MPAFNIQSRAKPNQPFLGKSGGFWPVFGGFGICEICCIICSLLVPDKNGSPGSEPILNSGVRFGTGKNGIFLFYNDAGHISEFMSALVKASPIICNTIKIVD